MHNMIDYMILLKLHKNRQMHLYMMRFLLQKNMFQLLGKPGYEK